MNKILLISLLLASFSISANEKCTEIKKDSERLACYDQADKPKEKSKETNKAPEKLGAWDIEKSKDDMDDSETVILSLSSNNAVDDFAGRERVPSLFIRCEQNKTEVVLAAGMQFDVESIRHENTLTVRYGKLKSKKVLATGSTDRKSTFFPKPLSTIREMLKVDNMIIKWTPFHANPVTARFTVTGLSSHIGDVQKACNWK